jgi:hypothetical protein
MKTQSIVPPWPRHLPRVFTDRARLSRNPLDGLPAFRQLDLLESHAASRLSGFDPRMTGLTNTYVEDLFVNEADHTAVSNTTSETSLLAGTNKQPTIPANHFLQQGAQFRGVRILARGVLSTTSTPTLIFQVRLGTTSGSSYLSGSSLGVSAAITTASGVTNKWWELRLDLVCSVRGIGTGNATLCGAGYVSSPGGFASPFVYPLEPTTPDTATWTQVFDASLTQFVNLSATWSAASASNTITCKQLIVSTIG